MDIHTQKELASLTTRFYAAQAESFSDTRQAGWPGWDRCAYLLCAHCKSDELHILDVGCGNMRFEKYLAGALPQCSLAFETVDNCAALIPDDLPACRIAHHDIDVVNALIKNSAQAQTQNQARSQAQHQPQSGLEDAPTPWGSEIAPVDVACSFGVMHHVPGGQNQCALLKVLLASVRSGGFVMVSLWRFMEVTALAEKALETLEIAKNDTALPQGLRAQLDCLAFQGDYLLGWQNKPGTYRYCHSFSNADTDALIASVEDRAKLIERFRADGRTGNANEYLVFQKTN